MNKIFIIIIMSISIFSQVFNLTKGWNLVGAVNDLKDLSIFTDERCNQEIFAYRNNKFLKGASINSNNLDNVRFSSYSDF